MWIIEGTAEFVGNLPYSEGGFTLEAGAEHLRRFFAPSPLLKKLAERRRPADAPAQTEVEIVPFDRLMRAPYWPTGDDPQVMRKRYNSSFLLVYYFVHLDPDRSRLPRFLLSARRLALELGAVERRARAYQREWIDPHNREVIENHARIQAFNRRVGEYNASLSSGGAVARPRSPIWAAVGAPPPPFTPTGQAATFYPPGAAIGIRPLEWTPPGPAAEAGPAAKPKSAPATQGPTGPPIQEWRPIPTPLQPSSPKPDPRNGLPSTAVMLTNQEAAFGTPEAIAERAREAFARHRFPLP
jgi:hypothetical protein